MKMGPGVPSHEGTELPEDDLRGKPRKRSWGVSFVVVHIRERIECNTSGRASCQCFTGRFLDLRHIVIAFQMVPLYLSTWPFPAGL